MLQKFYYNIKKHFCYNFFKFIFLDNFFLLAGGQENSLLEFSTALEAQIPCQSEKGILKFEFV